MKVIRLILQRLALGAITLFVVSVLIFSALEMLPGGFAEALLGRSATPQSIQAMRTDLGLDQPAAIRYLKWAGGLLHGDLGYSYAGAASTNMRRSVTGLIAPRLANTFFLAVTAAAIAVPLSIGLGILTAIRQDGWLDRISSSVALSTIALPEFFVAYLLMFWFAIKMRWLPSVSSLPPNVDFWQHLSKVILPSIAMTFVITAHNMRMTRSAIVDVLSRPYIEMAHLKGLSLTEIVLWHALPNAWAPIIAVVTINLAYLIVGVVVVEVVFVYPGIGQLMVDAVSSRDMPTVQACAMIFAATYVVLNLIADILTIVTNPRLLHSR